jgi:hypothetical protein
MTTLVKNGTCNECGTTDTTLAGEGLCLSCSFDSLGKDASGKLMQKALIKAIHQIHGQVSAYGPRIYRAFKTSDSGLSVKISIDLGDDSPGRIDVKTGVSFVEAKAKDVLESHVDEKQEELGL